MASMLEKILATHKTMIDFAKYKSKRWKKNTKSKPLRTYLRKNDNSVVSIRQIRYSFGHAMASPYDLFHCSQTYDCYKNNTKVWFQTQHKEKKEKYVKNKMFLLFLSFMFLPNRESHNSMSLFLERLYKSVTYSSLAGRDSFRKNGKVLNGTLHLKEVSLYSILTLEQSFL